MPSILQINLNHDALSMGVEIPLSPLEKWWSQLQERNARVRALEEDDEPAIPLRHWIRCPDTECNADASHLGATHLEGRMVRLCTRCRGFFEVT